MCAEGVGGDVEGSADLCDGVGLEELFEVLRIVVFGFGHYQSPNFFWACVSPIRFSAILK